MITFILVSHSQKISDGIVDMITQMVPSQDVKVISAGGTEDGGIGTDPMRIQAYIEDNAMSERIYLFADIGSSIMSIEMVLELIDESLKQKCVYLDAPIVEGAFIAAVQAMVDPSHDSILREVNKLKSDQVES
ncbi:MAG: PTS-dependent dihydroxyacetone kinase phosphotransferase subunit DhaM [Erysipelotrichia bacterium]|jgi:dihydroxyacetone kinase phosphotransfer subunit|nr:PTS-dependent dihydroxyacetone kinase phosphotransferase subunit DhaM [Erysipelotrichia bacterium]